jgi:hypothetical protein
MDIAKVVSLGHSFSVAREKVVQYSLAWQFAKGAGD